MQQITKVSRIAIDDVRNAEVAAKTLGDRYLRSRGWSCTCQTPGCFWVWEKTVDGKALIVGREFALSLQESIDHRAQLLTEPASE